MKTIAVLGGGLAGLAAAEALLRGGHRPIVFEQADRPGGFVGTERTDGWLIELGPNSFQEATPELTATIERLGLASERVEASAAAKNRYVVRDGQLVALPMSPPALIASPLFSWGAKFRILRELSRKPRQRAADISVADFVREHFGQELLDYAVQPFVSGIYAGDPAALSLKHAFPTLAALERSHGSILQGQIAAAKQRRREGRGGMPPVISFRSGLAALVSAYVARLPAETIRTGTTVTGLEPGPRWTVRSRSAAGETAAAVDGEISTLPARVLATLPVGPSRDTPLACLTAVAHPPSASVFLGYRHEQVRHPLDGFGVLVPAVEKRQVLGAIFSSTLFAGRAPDGHVALTVMAGGALNPHLAGLGRDELLAELIPDLRSLLGIEGEPVFLRKHAWAASIPQYAVGYGALLETIIRTEERYPGLLIGGMVRDGISLPAAIQAGERLAARV